MLKKLQVPKVSLTLSLLFLLVSCGPSGPLITDCVSNPKAGNFICYNEAQKKQIIQAPSQVDNWVFLSAADEVTEIKACANHLTAKVQVCVFDFPTLSFQCYNEVTSKGVIMPFAQSENWVGVSPVDEQILLDFCASKH